MEVLDVDVEKEEEDSDNDGEQLDQDMTNVINDTIREVCMDNPADIQSDIQKLASIVSDGVKVLYIAPSIAPILMSPLHKTTINIVPFWNYTTVPLFERQLLSGLFKRERVSSDRLGQNSHFQLRLKQALLKTHHQL